MSNMTTSADVARWMLEQVEKHKELYQMDVVYQINRKFGEEFTYQNDRGGLSISKNVLKEFRKISADTVVWERGMRLWRLRNKRDTPDRRQVDY